MDEQLEQCKEGFQLGCKMAANNNSLSDVLTTAYKIKGYIYKGDNPTIKQDPNFSIFIEGVVRGYTQHDNGNSRQYHNLKTTKSNLIRSLGAIGVIALITPIYFFSPHQMGFGVLLGSIIGGPILFQAIKASSNKI